jgi:protein phosphatase
MDLFRRIFGKTNEAIDNDVAKPSADTANTEPTEIDQTPVAELTPAARGEFEIDAATRPVGPPPSSRLPVTEGVTQPLSVDPIVSGVNGHITFGQSSDVGLVRTNNQDSALSFFFTSSSVEDRPDFGLFIVADGMGGHHDGEKASAITAKVVANYVTKHIYLPMISDSNDTELPPLTESLVASVQKANAEVISKVPEGGTTVTAVTVIGDLAHVVHVGDSRAYLLSPDGIEQITRDHSLVQRLIELDQLTPEDADTHPQKNVLYRALGQNEQLEVDVVTRRLPGNARLLICSDGLWGQIEEKELYEIAMNNVDPQQACDKLVALANTRGGVDNITVILLKVS